MLKICLLFVAVALSACGQAEPRSAQYFEAHADEARQVIAECQQGSASGDECDNARLAIKIDEDRKRFERFRGK